jgi:putative transposase
MREWQSISHVKWHCRNHIVFVPNYRKRSISGSLQKSIGGV